MNWGTNEKGTNEMGDQWVGGTNEMGDQWNGWCMGANWGTNEMGDQWDLQEHSSIEAEIVYKSRMK